MDDEIFPTKENFHQLISNANSNLISNQLFHYDTQSVVKKRKVIWTDPSTQTLENSIRHKLQTSIIDTQWTLPFTQTTQEEIFILNKHSQLLKHQQYSNNWNNVNFKRLPDLNKERLSNGTIHAFQQHPNSQLIFTASNDKFLHLFMPTQNKYNYYCKHSLRLEAFPIHSAAYNTHSNNQEIVMISRGKKYFYNFDINQQKAIMVPTAKVLKDADLDFVQFSPEGNFMSLRDQRGQLHIMNPKTKKLIHTIHNKNAARTNAFCFYSHFSQDYIITASDQGELGVFDLRLLSAPVKMLKTSYSLKDFGSSNTTAVNVCGEKNILATGNTSGTLNLYKFDLVSGKSIEFAKSLKNVRTKIEYIEFGKKEVIWGGSERKNELRIAKLEDSPEGFQVDVCQKWPGRSVESFGTVNVVRLLKHANKSKQVLAIAGEKGRVSMFRF